MNHRTVLAITILLFIIVVPSMAQTSTPAEVTEWAGLRKVTFAVPSGRINILLPNDMAAGDTISGTVFTEPGGSDQAEKANNQGVLNGYVLDFGNDKKIPTNKPGFLLESGPIIPEPVNGRTIKLLSVDGKSVSTANIPILASPGTKPPANFTIPPLGQTGRPVTITGPFDGNSSNTGIAIRGEKTQVLAESPRKAVYSSPTTAVGPSDVKINENGRETTGTTRNLKIDLSASKTNLMRGEKTDVTVQVNGLDGIKSPVSVQMITTGSVNTQGGNTQTIRIKPKQVGSNGTYSQTFGLTGITNGSFSVTATVLNR